MSYTQQPVVLTIAGSDSSCGAGIQADLKTFAALNVYGCSAITALTAQNTMGVHNVFPIHPSFVQKQIEVILDDFSVATIKIGMLSNSKIVEAVISVLTDWSDIPVVLDPVMVATSGNCLLDKDAISALKELIPKATLLTPNLAEAAVLTHQKVPKTMDEMNALVDPLLSLGCKYILLKGGHLNDLDHSNDIFCNEQEIHILKQNRIHHKNTHGTGCTLSSACAAYIALKFSLLDAVTKAKRYVTGALKRAHEMPACSGHGSLHHFFK